MIIQDVPRGFIPAHLLSIWANYSIIRIIIKSAFHSVKDGDFKHCGPSVNVRVVSWA